MYSHVCDQLGHRDSRELKMSLFQFGFTRCSTTISSGCDQSVPSYLPQQDESCLFINIDQTPSSYVSVGKKTSKGSKSVAITGRLTNDKITLAFSITFSGQFLPLQVIYAGKTKASHPHRYSFPTEFNNPHGPFTTNYHKPPTPPM